MPIKQIQKLPGLPDEAERQLREYLNELSAAINKLDSSSRITPLLNTSHAASENTIVRIRGGKGVTLPRARASNGGAWVWVFLETAGTLTVTALGGTVNGASTFSATEPGLYAFQSNGAGGWLTAPDQGSDSPSSSERLIVNADIYWNAQIALSKLANIAANSIVCNPTAAVAVPDDLAISADSFPARVGGNLVSHPFSTLAGASLDYSAGVINVDVDETAHVTSVFSGDAIGFRKSRQRDMWWDDFDYIDVEQTGAFTSGIPTSIDTGPGNWTAEAISSNGNLSPISGETNHPGILVLTTGAAINAGFGLHKGSAASTTWVRASQVYLVEAILRMAVVTNIVMYFGILNRSAVFGTINSGAYFVFDTAAASNPTQVHTVTAVGTAAGDITDQSTGTVPGTGFNVYTVIQDTAGTFDFYMDDVLETTHTTDVPTTQIQNVMIGVLTRNATAKALDVDYVAFESAALGARTS